MQEISLILTIEETNLVLEALGNLPFVRVFALIGKIQEQARQRLHNDTPAPGAQALETPSLPAQG